MESDPAARIRSEPIAPPDPPDDEMAERMRETFVRIPRIAEAWVAGARLRRLGESASWNTTYVVLVLDPPIDREKDPAAELSQLESELQEIGFRNEPTRTWVYAGRKSFRPRPEHGARLIYSQAGDERTGL